MIIHIRNIALSGFRSGIIKWNNKSSTVSEIATLSYLLLAMTAMSLSFSLYVILNEVKDPYWQTGNMCAYARLVSDFHFRIHTEIYLNCNYGFF